jgi:hypothetical protein
MFSNQFRELQDIIKEYKEFCDYSYKRINPNDQQFLDLLKYRDRIHNMGKLMIQKGRDMIELFNYDKIPIAHDIVLTAILQSYYSMRMRKYLFTENCSFIQYLLILIELSKVDMLTQEVFDSDILKKNINIKNAINEFKLRHRCH